MNAQTALDLFSYFTEQIESGQFSDESSLELLAAHRDAYEKMYLDLSKNENHLFSELGVVLIDNDTLSNESP